MVGCHQAYIHGAKLLLGDIALGVVARSRYDRKHYCKKYLFHIL
jgi:hypothetical protein